MLKEYTFGDKKSTYTATAYAELARFPLFYRRPFALIKYLLKLLIPTTVLCQIVMTNCLTVLSIIRKSIRCL